VKSLKQRAISAFAWDYSGALVRQATTFAIGVFLARLLTPREFGLVGMVMVLIEMSHAILDLGLGAALIQRKHPSPLHYSSTFVLNIGLGVLLTLATLLVAPWIARFYALPELLPIARALSPVFFLRSLVLVHDTWLRKHLRFDRLTQIQLASAFVGGCTGIIFAWTGLGVWSLVGQTLATALASVAGFWLFGGWEPRARISLGALRELWGFGIHLFAAGMLDQLFAKIDVLIVGKLFNATTLGLFSRAKTMARFIVRFSSDSIAQVMFPVLSEIQDDTARFHRAAGQTLAIVSFGAFALTGWLFCVASPLISVLLTDKWLAAAPILRLFCFSTYVYPVNSVVLSLLTSSGHSRAFLRLEIIKKAFYMAALFVGFRFGVSGYLVALAVVGFINTLINVWVTGRAVDLPLTFFATGILPYSLTAVAASWFALLLPVGGSGNVVRLVLSTVGFTGMYLGLNIIFRTRGLRLALTIAAGLVRKWMRFS